MTKSVYKTKVTVKSGRAGHAKSADGFLDVRLSPPRSLGGRENTTNPEQLFGAGYAACFGSSMLGMAKQLKIDLKDVTVDAEVDLLQTESGYGLKVELSVKPGGISQEEAQQVINAAHKVCAYSYALRGNAEVAIHLDSSDSSGYM